LPIIPLRRLDYITSMLPVLDTYAVDYNRKNIKNVENAASIIEILCMCKF